MSNPRPFGAVASAAVFGMKEKTYKKKLQQS